MRKIILMLLCSLSAHAYAQLPQVSNGSIQRLKAFPSKYVQSRNVDIYLPENYSPEKQYSVLYMHDGQMLFDATNTWNKQEWMVDEHVSKLIDQGIISDCIVVGVWNAGAYRHTDYFPEKALKYLPEELQKSEEQKLMGNPLGDEYLLFLTRELKPFIDKEYATYTDAAHTFIMGSSMGALISIYAICEYPDIFGAAACMSTHWVGDTEVKNDLIPKAFNSYLESNLPDPKHHRIYFDYGTETLDSLYPPYQEMIDKTMQAKGFIAKNWVSKVFVGAAHTENSWNKRLDIPLTFLLKKE